MCVRTPMIGPSAAAVRTGLPIGFRTDRKCTSTPAQCTAGTVPPDVRFSMDPSEREPHPEPTDRKRTRCYVTVNFANLNMPENAGGGFGRGTQTELVNISIGIRKSINNLSTRSSQRQRTIKSYTHMHDYMIRTDAIESIIRLYRFSVVNKTTTHKLAQTRADRNYYDFETHHGVSSKMSCIKHSAHMRKFWSCWCARLSDGWVCSSVCGVLNSKEDNSVSISPTSVTYSVGAIVSVYSLSRRLA